MRLYLPAIDVKRDDVLITTYAEMPVFETYENRRGHACICVESPYGQQEFRYRKTTKVLIDRPYQHDPDTLGHVGKHVASCWKLLARLQPDTERKG